MAIDRKKLVDAIYEAVDKFIETYNDNHDSIVDVSTEGDEIVVDGGHVHGLFTVSVVQD